MTKKGNKYSEETEVKVNNLLDLALENQKVIKVEDVVEGTVVAIEKSGVYISIPPYGTGIIYGYEYLQAKDIIRRLNVGDTVTVKIIDLENQKGYIELSLKEAKAALVWTDAEIAMKQKTTLNLPVQEANRGGLIIEWNGLQGFLPSSQLSKEHYPKVEDGDKEKITKELKKLVGKKLELQIITANPKEGKLIFSEKGASLTGVTPSPTYTKGIAPIQKYQVGDVIEGIISGVVEFGLFIKMPDKVEGLVHISEISWSLIENPKAIYKTGEKIKAKIIEIKDGKISLSIKALTENPWNLAASRYQKGQKVSGVVIKFSKHGALISIEEGVAGLLHISEFGSEINMKKMLSLGKICHCYITVFDPKEEKMILTLKENK